MLDALVDNGSMVDSMMSRDHRLCSMVVVDVPVQDWLNDILDVMVHSLIDGLTLVDNLMLILSRLYLITVAVLAGDGIEKISILGRRLMLFINFGRRVNLSVSLFLVVLLIGNVLDVVLNMSLVCVQLLLPLDLFNFMSVSLLVCDVAKVLDAEE